MACTAENDQALNDDPNAILTPERGSRILPGSMSQDIHQFINSNIDSASNAWQRLGGTEHYYRFGNINLRVRHVGNTLVDTVTPAIQHALVHDSPTTFNGTVYTLDASALSMPKPPEVWPFATETFQGHQRIHWDPDSGLALNSDETRGIWQLFNLASGNGLYWVKNERTLPSWEAGSPLRIFLHWLAWQTGNQLIHAAGLEWNRTGILLTGPGGSGKSTTTAAAIKAGWKTIGDDFVLLSDRKTPVASCIYDTVKLTQQSLDKIAGMAGKVVNLSHSADDKVRVHLGVNYRQQLISELPIKAVFALQISNMKDTSILPASKAYIMTALAPTTMFMLKTGMRESFGKMTGLVNRLPCFVIRLGTSPAEAIDKMTVFLAEAGI